MSSVGVAITQIYEMVLVDGHRVNRNTTSQFLDITDLNNIRCKLSIYCHFTVRVAVAKVNKDQSLIIMTKQGVSQGVSVRIMVLNGWNLLIFGFGHLCLLSHFCPCSLLGSVVNSRHSNITIKSPKSRA